MSKIWYVLRSKPNKESFLTHQLDLEQIEHYYPSLKVTPVNPRSRKIKPYFPGYLFIPKEAVQASEYLFNRLPGAVGLLYIGGEVASVPDTIVQAIRLRVDDINQAGGETFEALQTLKPGDRITIDAGPFKGYEAVLDARISGTERVKVFLTMLEKQIMKVELPVDAIRPLKKKSSPGRQAK